MIDGLAKYIFSATCLTGLFLFGGCGSSQEVDQDGPSTYDDVYDGWEPKEGEETKHGKSDKKPVVSKKDDKKDPKKTKDPETEPEVVDPVIKKDDKKTKPENKPSRAEPKTKSEFHSRFIEESEAAFDASDVYFNSEGEEKNEAYVVWAEHLYAALAYANHYTNKGGKLDDLPKLQKLKQLKAGDFKAAFGPSDDIRVKKAIRKWQQSTN
ncbi:MAG: hypothetical protein ACYTDT_05725 [Planctomycetota bacterium]|jgi:hypothetical protein